MTTKLKYLMISAVTLGLAGSFNGCTCNAEAEMGNAKPQTPAAPPPPAPPPPPPAPPPVAAAPTPPPAPHMLVPVGKAKIEGNKVKIPGELEFDLDKATIKDTQQSKDILTTLADFMKQNPNVTKLRVEGHTDNQGQADHNMKLSQERADAVKKWLVDHGVDAGRLTTQGYGQTHPLVDNDTADHKAMNRRTEFHVAEIDGKPAPEDASSSSTTPAATPGTTATPAGASTSTTPASTPAPTKTEKKPDTKKTEKKTTIK